MSRKNNIRWRKDDSEELTKAVRNFNSKIDRIAKKNPELKNALPDKMSIRELKELINTRQDLKREINSLRRFSKRGSEDIVSFGDYNTQVTKWQKNEINRRIGVINRRRKQRLDALEGTEVTSRGEKTGYKRKDIGMGKAEKLELAPMTGLTRGMNERDVKMKFRNVLKQSQTDFYTLKDFRAKNNYITGLKQNFNENDIKDIIKTIEDMSLSEFLKIFNSDNDAKFEGLYPGNINQTGKYIKSLRAVWNPERLNT